MNRAVRLSTPISNDRLWIVTCCSVFWLLLALPFTACSDTRNGTEPAAVLNGAQARALRGPYQVVHVVDGDTIEVSLEGRSEKVRYIGVNTPETKHPTKGQEPYGPEAFAENRRLVEGRSVYLEFDVQERDRYGRLLAYVYRDAEGQDCVNATLVKNGFAQVMTIAPNVKYQDRFVTLQREAREAQRGLWGLPGQGVATSSGDDKARAKENATTIYVASARSQVFHRADCRSVKDIADKNRREFKTRDEALKAGKKPCGTCKP